MERYGDHIRLIDDTVDFVRQKRDSARTPDTRISAHTMPRSVATTSAHTNTSTVTSAPFASSGRYSARSARESTADD